MNAPYDPGALRIGDAERDTAAAALGEHFAAGRLDSEEYDDRIGRVWASRTRAELPPLFDDLPGGTPDPLRLPVGPPPRPVAPSADHWVAGPSHWQQRQRAVAARASGLPVWVMVLAAIVVLPVAFVVISTALPVIVAGLIAWFFLAGPGKSGAHGHHQWNRSSRR